MKLLRGSGWSCRQPKDTAEPSWMAAKKLFLISFLAERRAGLSTVANISGPMAGLPANAKFADLFQKRSSYSERLDFWLPLFVSPSRRGFEVKSSFISPLNWTRVGLKQG